VIMSKAQDSRAGSSACTGVPIVHQVSDYALEAIPKARYG
jgi:hypothetical protein